MAILAPVSYMQNRTDHSAQTDRLAISGLLLPTGAVNTWRGGVRGAFDLKVSQQGSPNMSVLVAAGQANVPAGSSLQGTYSVMNDGNVTLTIGAAHATLPRNDLVILRVVDTFFDGGSTDAGQLEVVPGSAASVPSDPAVTGSYIPLARIVVPGGATSISDSDIVDLRPRLTAAGGILHVNTSTERSALTPFEGMMIYYVPDQIHQGYIDGEWKAVGGVVEDTGWILSGHGFTTAPGWTLQQDIAVRKIGNQCWIDTGAIERSGSTINVPTNGNIVNSDVLIVPVGWQPVNRHNGALNGGRTGRGCNYVCYADTGNGSKITMVSCVPGSDITTGEDVSIIGTWVIG